MKIFNGILCSVAFTFSVACYADMVSEQYPEVLFTIEQESLCDSINNFSTLYTNGKGDVVWLSYIKFKYNEGCICYYSNTELHGERVDLSKIISNALMQLGFAPPWSQTLNESESKIWGSEYYVTYGIHIIGIDEFGNVLVTFYHGVAGELAGQWHIQLGVWHKDRGFKFLPTNGIDYIQRVYFEHDQIIVVGVDETYTISRCVVLSAANGFWGERKQEIATPAPEIEQRPEVTDQK